MQTAANATYSNSHLELFITSVVIPFCFVLLMNGIEGLFERLTFPTWRHRLMKIAWDNCVLALGLVGGVLSNPEVNKNLTPGWTLISAIGSILAALSTAILIGYWRKEDPPKGTEIPPKDIGAPPKGWKVFLSLALSGGVLAIPSYLALAR